MTRPYLVIAGQSNGEILDPSPTLCARFRVIQCALSGAYLDVGGTPDYAPGSFLETTLGNCLLRSTGRPVFCWWIQGEADSLVEAYALAYAANLATLVTNVETASSRSDVYWVDTLLHGDINTATYVYASTVNAQKTTAAIGDLLDPTSHGSLVDGVHWDTDLRTAMMDLFASTYGL